MSRSKHKVAQPAPAVQPGIGPMSPSPRPLSRSHWLILIAILLAGIGLRSYQLGHLSLWLDELFSLALSTGHYPDPTPLQYNQVIQPLPNLTGLRDARPWWQIWSVMHDGCHPPLYEILLRFWRHAFGEGAIAARSFSLVASVGSILLAFYLGRMILGAVGGLWTAGLMAVAWPQLQFAQEARPYAMVVLLGLAAMVILLAIEHRGPSLLRLTALGACMLAMALTHYFSFGALLALGLYAAIALRSSSRWKTLAAMAIAGAIFLAAWGPALWNQRHADYAFLNDVPDGHVIRTLFAADALPERFLVDLSGLQIPLIGTIVFVLPAFFLRRRPELLLPYLWLVFTAGFIILLDLFRMTTHLAWLRYTMLASPGLYVLIAGAIRSKTPLVAQSLPALAVLCCVLVFPAFYGRYKEDWRSLGAFLHANAAETEPLIFAAAQNRAYPMDMCICLTHYEHNDKRAVLVLDGAAPSAAIDRLRPYHRAWVISDYIDPGELGKRLPGCKIIRDERVQLTPGEAPAMWCLREVEFTNP